LEESGDQGVAFVLDLTERKEAEENLRRSEQRYREAQMALAHSNRITTMGQLTASIAHEVNQPISGVVTNAYAALRFLDGHPPDLGEIREALEDIIKDGNRAAGVISRIRALIKKAPPRTDDLEINEVILEVVGLTQGQMMKNGVSLQTQLAANLPMVKGDRIQLQQVLLNLIINAIEAMSGVHEGTRELLIGTQKDASSEVMVTVQDSGPGLDPESFHRLFDPFYTTKNDGMGMGLSICRSIIEAHGGKMWASSNDGAGATFQFSLPPCTKAVSKPPN
jgi:C4-dicarboxylate-specific signal transduction histidine kinase